MWVFHVNLGIKSKGMDNNRKQVELHLELAKKLMAEKRSKAEILADFVGAGILDIHGEFTEPYKELRKLKRTKV
jgi:hypothetical protein